MVVYLINAVLGDVAEFHEPVSLLVVHLASRRMPSEIDGIELPYLQVAVAILG